MDIITALLIASGLLHPAPAQYHAPVKTLPLIVTNDGTVLAQWDWSSK